MIGLWQTLHPLPDEKPLIRALGLIHAGYVLYSFDHQWKGHTLPLLQGEQYLTEVQALILETRLFRAKIGAKYIPFRKKAIALLRQGMREQGKMAESDSALLAMSKLPNPLVFGQLSTEEWKKALSPDKPFVNYDQADFGEVVVPDCCFAAIDQTYSTPTERLSRKIEFLSNLVPARQ